MNGVVFRLVKFLLLWFKSEYGIWMEDVEIVVEEDIYEWGVRYGFEDYY